MASNFRAFKVDEKDVTTAGTAEKLPNLEVPDDATLVIRAKKANTGNIQVAETQTKAQSGPFFTLAADESISLDVINANMVWIDATISTEGVELLVEQQGS